MYMKDASCNIGPDLTTGCPKKVPVACCYSSATATFFVEHPVLWIHPLDLSSRHFPARGLFGSKSIYHKNALNQTNVPY